MSRLHIHIQRIQKLIEEGSLYEAHQQYRSVFYRLKGQQKCVEAVNLLVEGSKQLMDHGERESAIDLIMLFIDYLSECKKLSVSDDLIVKCGELHQMLPPVSPERETFRVKSVRWSNKDNPGSCSASNLSSNTNYSLLSEAALSVVQKGNNKLHRLFAESLWKEKNYSEARRHYVYSEDGRAYATMLIEYQTTCGYPSEVDLFITQAVLQYLCLAKVPVAHVLFYTYTKNHPKVNCENPPFLLPLLNFIAYLLSTIQRRQLAVFTILVEYYQPSLQRDVLYTSYLDKIGQIFFGLPPPGDNDPSQMQANITHPSLMGNIMQSLFGGGASADLPRPSSSAPPPPPPATTTMNSSSSASNMMTSSSTAAPTTTVSVSSSNTDETLSNQSSDDYHSCSTSEEIDLD